MTLKETEQLLEMIRLKKLLQEFEKEIQKKNQASKLL